MESFERKVTGASTVSKLVDLNNCMIAFSSCEQFVVQDDHSAQSVTSYPMSVDSGYEQQQQQYYHPYYNNNQYYNNNHYGQPCYSDNQYDQYDQHQQVQVQDPYQSQILDQRLEYTNPPSTHYPTYNNSSEQYYPETVSQPEDHYSNRSSQVPDIFSLTRHNHYSEVERLLDHGFSANLQDIHGNTVLIIACQNGLKRLAKLALRRGADIDMQNYNGNTALHFCFGLKLGDTLGAYLIGKGANPNVQNHFGRTSYEGFRQASERM